MNWAATEVKRLSSLQKEKPGRKGSLMGQIDRTAKRHGLGDAIKRIEPQGESVQVRFEMVEFNKMLMWLDQLNAKDGLQVQGAVIERTENSGLINARIVIGKSAS